MIFSFCHLFHIFQCSATGLAPLKYLLNLNPPLCRSLGASIFATTGARRPYGHDLMLSRSNSERKVWRQARLSVCLVRRRLEEAISGTDPEIVGMLC